MIIAEQKRNENIAEYLIYMYQVEDLIRANGLDLQRIEKNLINAFDASYDVKREMLEWYKGLINEMISEKKQKSGHINSLNNIADSLNELNVKILHKPMQEDVKNAYDKAKPNIEALRMRSGYQRDHDVQLALNGLYGLLILKLQKKEITGETEKAFRTISEWISLLATEYMHQNE